MFSPLALVLPLAAAEPQAKCTPIPESKCGTEKFGNCLKCGKGIAVYDCEYCCPSCKQIVKGKNKYCDCDDPGPPPGPDTWNEYQVAGMDVLSVTGGGNRSKYERVVVLLHGGGGSGTDWQYQYQDGWFGNLTGLKYVFPTSAIPSHVWFNTYKIPSCGLADDCAYDVPSIRESAGRIASLLEYEAGLLGGDHSKVFLAGFSEGAQLTGYVQLVALDYALGGAIVMDGFPLPPLFDMVGKDPTAAKQNATYYGPDMRWMIYHGEADPIFPCTLTIDTWNGIFAALEATATLKIEHTEPGMSHVVTEDEFTQLVAFVRSG